LGGLLLHWSLYQAIMNYTLYTLAQRPELSPKIDQLSSQSWPQFLLHGNIYRWGLLFEVFAQYQLLLCDSSDNLIAVGHTVPLVWDGSVSNLPATIEEIIVRAEQDYLNQQAPTTFSALAVMVSSTHRGHNLSSVAIQEMKSLARQHACTALIAPVRPTCKSRYPLAPMERYVEWKRPDGALFDPWLRVHWRLGAEPLCIAPNTLTVEGTVADWEEWTEMAFPESGSYVVPGALQPVRIDCEHNLGHYEDPNYWVKHSVAS
jgi:hypothetical protein